MALPGAFQSSIRGPSLTDGGLLGALPCGRRARDECQSLYQRHSRPHLLYRAKFLTLLRRLQHLPKDCASRPPHYVRPKPKNNSPTPSNMHRGVSYAKCRQTLQRPHAHPPIPFPPVWTWTSFLGASASQIPLLCSDLQMFKFSAKRCDLAAPRPR